MGYLTGYDPRFEESLLILVPGRAPVLLVGNEGESYAKVVPDGIQVVRYQSFSLVNQDRSASPRLGSVLSGAGLGDGARRVGIAGWKYFDASEAESPESWVDAPAFIVDSLRALGCVVVNATALFTAPGRGQLDIIPATGTAYHTSNIEDGVALADDALRAEVAARYPGMWQRVLARRAFMADALGIVLKPEVLPLSNLAGYLPPLWLSPQLAMRRS
jgi:hypothetical protein